MARKQKMSRIEALLQERRSALRQALAGDDNLLRQLSQRSGGDEVDFALDTASVEVDSQLIEVISRELANVEIALDRVKRGKYGKCDVCGCNITAARLEVLPYASSCIECQRASENQGRRGDRGGDWSRILEQPADDLRITDFDVNIS